MSDEPLSDQDTRPVERSPFADRTRSTTEHGTRNAADLRTHTERINGVGAGRFGDAEALPEPQIDRNAPRRPYRTTAVSVMRGAIVAPGSTVWLQPHEVGAHHVALPTPEEPPAPAVPRRSIIPDDRAISGLRGRFAVPEAEPSE